MSKEKERSLGVHDSVIVGPEAQTGNISIKADRKQVSPNLNSESESTPSVHSSVIVGPKGQTGNISIQTKTKVVIYFAGFVSGVITSLCASAIWAGICTIWEHTIKPLMDR